MELKLKQLCVYNKSQIPHLWNLCSTLLYTMNWNGNCCSPRRKTSAEAAHIEIHTKGKLVFQLKPPQPSKQPTRSTCTAHSSSLIIYTYIGIWILFNPRNGNWNVYMSDECMHKKYSLADPSESRGPQQTFQSLQKKNAEQTSNKVDPQTHWVVHH